MKKIILAIAAIATMASCTKNDSVETTDVWNGELRISSGITTRASGTSWESGDEIGVFMSETGTTTAVGVHNTKYTTSSTSTTATFAVDSENYADLYYPQSGNVDIVAHYPHLDDNSVSVSSYPIDLKNTPIDFMSAKMVDVEKSKSELELEFYHLLSQINVTLSPNGGLTADELKTATVKISGMKLAATATVDYDTNNKVPTATFETSGYDQELSQTAADSEASFIIVPQTATVTFTITVDNVGEFYATASNATFTSGDEHNYAISVSRTAAKIEGAIINSWGTEGAGGPLDATEYMTSTSTAVTNVTAYPTVDASGNAQFVVSWDKPTDTENLNYYSVRYGTYTSTTSSANTSTTISYNVTAGTSYTICVSTYASGSVFLATTYLNDDENATVTAYDISSYTDAIPTLAATPNSENTAIDLVWGNTSSADLVSVALYISGSLYGTYSDVANLPTTLDNSSAQITSISYTATFKPAAYSESASVTTAEQTVTI